MKILPRIAATGLAASILMGGGIAGAMANDAPAPPMVQSNIEVTKEMLTVEIVLKDHSHFYEKLGGGASIGTTHVQVERGGGIPATPIILDAAGNGWRIAYLEPNRSFRKGIGFYYLSEADVATEQPLGTAAATKKIADAAAEALQTKHFAQFDGTGVVKGGGKWYSSEDSTQPPLAVAEGLGYEGEMSAAYEAAGQTWHKLALHDMKTGYVLASDVSSFTPTPEPTEEPTSTPEPSEAPLIGDPDDHPANNHNAGDKASDQHEASSDQPANLGILVGGGLAVAAAAGGYLYWQQRKKKGAAGAAAAGEEVSSE